MNNAREHIIQNSFEHTKISGSAIGDGSVITPETATKISRLGKMVAADENEVTVAKNELIRRCEELMLENSSGRYGRNANAPQSFGLGGILLVTIGAIFVIVGIAVPIIRGNAFANIDKTGFLIILFAVVFLALIFQRATQQNKITKQMFNALKIGAYKAYKLNVTTKMCYLIEHSSGGYTGGSEGGFLLGGPGYGRRGYRRAFYGRSASLRSLSRTGISNMDYDPANGDKYFYVDCEGIIVRVDEHEYYHCDDGILIFIFELDKRLAIEIVAANKEVPDINRATHNLKEIQKFEEAKIPKIEGLSALDE